MSENLKLGMESLWYGINLWISCLVFLLPLRRKTHFKVKCYNKVVTEVANKI